MQSATVESGKGCTMTGLVFLYVPLAIFLYPNITSKDNLIQIQKTCDLEYQSMKWRMAIVKLLPLDRTIFNRSFNTINFNINQNSSILDLKKTSYSFFSWNNFCSLYLKGPFGKVTKWYSVNSLPNPCTLREAFSRYIDITATPSPQMINYLATLVWQNFDNSYSVATMSTIWYFLIQASDETEKKELEILGKVGFNANRFYFIKKLRNLRIPPNVWFELILFREKHIPESWHRPKAIWMVSNLVIKFCWNTL